MELKAIMFEQMLDNELRGKNVGYGHWNFSGAVYRLLRQLANDCGLDGNDFSYKANSNNSIYLTYKGTSFGEASFKKKKGAYKYGSYDWTFEKCFVFFWNEESSSYFRGLTFQEMLDKIVADKAAAEDRETKKLELAKEVYQMIKDKLGADDYGTRSFIEYLNSKRYTVSN